MHIRLVIDTMKRAVLPQIVHDIAHATVEQKVGVLSCRVHQVELAVQGKLCQLCICLVVCDDQADVRNVLDMLDEPRDELIRNPHCLLVKLLRCGPIIRLHSGVRLLERSSSRTGSTSVRDAFERPTSSVKHDYDLQVREQQLLKVADHGTVMNRCALLTDNVGGV
eukprot:5234431-Prymnesium_polylepis.1